MTADKKEIYHAVPVLVIGNEFSSGIWRRTAWEYRVRWALSILGERVFTRKQYRGLFQGMATATGSNDLRNATASGIIRKKGDKALTRYEKIPEAAVSRAGNRTRKQARCV